MFTNSSLVNIKLCAWYDTQLLISYQLKWPKFCERELVVNSWHEITAL